MASAALVISQAPLLGALLRHAPVALWGHVAVFTLLAYLGDRVRLQVRGMTSQSLSTAIHVAAILLFPPPLPLLITLVALLVSETRRTDMPAFKRAFNLCHALLNVGVSSLVFAQVATPGSALRPAHVLATVPALLLLLGLYYLLDAGLMLVVFALLQRQKPWSLWWRTSRHSLGPEFMGEILGILVAIVWLYQPLCLVLLLVPMAILRTSLRAAAQAERRGEHLEAVLVNGQRLRLQLSAAEIVRHVAATAQTIAGASAVVAYLPDPDAAARFERVALEPADTPRICPRYIPAPAPVAGLHAVEADDEAIDLPLVLERDRESAAVAGVLRLLGVAAPLQQDTRDVLAILATQTAMALENARLHERALAQASEDGLTGLLNHRAFQTRLEQEIARAQRNGGPLTLVMIDLDGFGAVNNTHGHQTGDAALAAVAQAIREHVREADIPARYGGDEFAIILPEASVEEGVDVAERVRAALKGLTVVHNAASIRVGASFGVAALPLHAHDRETLIRAADDAAYAAKRAGKNTVRRAEDGILPRDPAVLEAQLQHANMATVEALAAAVDAKDQYTRGHSNRVSAYAVALAEALRLDEADITRIRLAGLLHDVGKIGVPDAILTKPDKLTAEEFDAIKEHPVIGERMLAAVPFLSAILPAVRHHHERWDGRGYPDGLAGADIHPDAAILAVADSFDAMTSSRTYRPALPVDEACRRVREGRGTQFAPHVVDAFERAVADGTFAPRPPSTTAPLTLLRPAS